MNTSAINNLVSIGSKLIEYFFWNVRIMIEYMMKDIEKRVQSLYQAPQHSEKQRFPDKSILNYFVISIVCDTLIPIE